MIKSLLIALLALISIRATAPEYECLYIEQGRILNDPFLVLWDHVKYVETRDSVLINHVEKAYGKGQITPIKLREYNRERGTHYTLNDCLDESVSIEIFLYHCRKYATFEMAAKRWNGSGPATILYWNKVQTLPLFEYRLRSITLCLTKEKMTLRL